VNLSSLKNINLGSLSSKIKGVDLFNDKKILVRLGAGFGAIIIFLIAYYAFISPIVKKQEEKIQIMHERQNKIAAINDNTGKLIVLIKKLEPEYLKNSKLFHSRKEVEDLYQNISKFATINDLSIINLRRMDPQGVGKGGTQDQNSAGQDAAPPLYFKIPVNYKIQGGYLGYLKFRRALAKSIKVINFDKEVITVQAEETAGLIFSEGTISIVGLPDEHNN